MALAFGEDLDATLALPRTPLAAAAGTMSEAPARLPIGLHRDVPENVYHADPAETPSASSSILKTLVDQSPMHAWWDQPRLNPEFEAAPSTKAQQEGTILHSLVLGTPALYDVLPFDDYKLHKGLNPSNAAQLARDATLAAGRIPILRREFDELAKVAGRLNRHIHDAHPDVVAALADPETLFEVTIICRIRGVLCRVRVDCLPPPRYGFALDLKFTGRSAEPEGWGRKLVSDHLFQADLYPRAIKEVRGDKPEFRFLVCETDPPSGVSKHAMDPQMEDLASRKVNRGLDLWSRCLTANNWPGYSPEVHYQEPPPWELARWEAREYRDSCETPGETYARLYNAAGGPPT